MFFSLFAPSIVGATSKQGLQEYMIDSNTTNTDKITDDLRAAFNEKEYVSFLIKFKKKANVKDAINKAKTKAEKEGLSSRKAEHLRNSAILSGLKTVAFEEQQNVNEYLQNAVEDGQATDVQSFYIVNGMAVTATEEVAEKVATYDEVDYVTKEETRQLIEPEVEEKGVIADDNIEWNVDRVGAPSAWEEGYDGSGAVVASIDS